MSGTRTALRTVDLARAAGVSTQQIRNYLDTGILPPATRTPAGYRRFEERHRRAVLAYRALARGHGAPQARAIMQSVHDGDLPAALALVDAGHAALHEERRTLRATAEALETIAGRSPENAVTRERPRPGMLVGEVAARLGVRPSALRVWEAEGLLNPRREPGTGYRRYGAADVRDAQMIHMLRQGHYPLPRIRVILDGLRRTGGTEALRAAVAERGENLVRRATAMLEGAARLHTYVT